MKMTNQTLKETLKIKIKIPIFLFTYNAVYPFAIGILS